MAPTGRPGNRKWYRDHFHDHPLLASKNPVASVTGKPKLYCKECFSYHLTTLQANDQKEVDAGSRPYVRTFIELENYCKLHLKPIMTRI